MNEPTITPHREPAWCHLCERTQLRTADVWNVRGNGRLKARVCDECAERVVEALRAA